MKHLALLATGLAALSLLFLHFTDAPPAAKTDAPAKAPGAPAPRERTRTRPVQERVLWPEHPADTKDAEQRRKEYEAQQ